MMDKRGASHADWAISLGIFLLYILSMMMIIQPGVQPFYKEDELLSVVTENYKAYTSFTFYKTPIIIDTTGKDFAGPDNYKVQVNMQMPFSGEINNYAITNFMGVKIPFYIENGWVSFSFDANIIDGRNGFYIISNKLGDGSSKTYQRPPQAFTPVLVNDKNFTLIIGSTETLEGVSDTLIMRDVKDVYPGVYCMEPALERENKYDFLKSVWRFPRSKDFRIFYTTTASAQYSLSDIVEVCSFEEPYEQANVVVDEWATRMFVPNAVGEYDGKSENIIPIRMVARVW